MRKSALAAIVLTLAAGSGLVYLVTRDDSDRASLVVIDYPTGEEHRLGSGSEAVFNAEWAASGELVGAAEADEDGRSFSFWNTDNGERSSEEPFIAGESPANSPIAAEPGGDRFAFVYASNTAPGTAVVATIRPGESQVVVSEISGGPSNPVPPDIFWSSNGSRIAMPFADEVIIVRTDGSGYGVLEHNLGRVAVIGWTADNRALYVVPFLSNNRVTVLSLDIETGASKVEFSVDGEHHNGAAVSPDGTMLAAVLDYRLVVASKNGERITVNDEYTQGAVQPAWSPSGRRVAMALDPGLLVYDLDANRTRLFLNHDGLLAHSVSWSPDGERIAVVTQRAHRGD